MTSIPTRAPPSRSSVSAAASELTVGADSAPLRHDIALRAMSAPWWPRGVGLHVDEGVERLQYEPQEGVRDWIRIRRGMFDGSHAEGLAWSADEGFECRGDDVRLDGLLFSTALVCELRAQTGGLSSEAARKLPADGAALIRELRAGANLPLSQKVSWTRLPRPPVGAWMPGEVLSQPRTMGRTVSGAAAGSESVKAEVASLLGATLLHRFDWHDPVAISPEPFQRLEAERSLNPEAVHAWSLAVSDSGEDIELILHEGRARRSLGVVLPRGAHQQGTYVFRPRVSDDLQGPWEVHARLIHGACRRVGRVMVPVGAVDVPVGRPLAGIHPKGRLLVAGHGHVWPVPGRLPYTSALAGFGPDALVKELLAEGLPRDFAGSIHLASCNTGGGPGDTSTYAHRLEKALARRGFRGVTVAAPPGAMHGSHRAMHVLPKHLVSGTGRTIRAARALIRNLEQERRRTDVDDAHRAVCAKLIAEQHDHVDRIKALNSPRLNGREVPFHRRILGKLQWIWRGFKSALGLRHAHMEPWSPKDLELKNQAKVRGAWGRIGPRSP